MVFNVSEPPELLVLRGVASEVPSSLVRPAHYHSLSAL